MATNENELVKTGSVGTVVNTDYQNDTDLVRVKFDELQIISMYLPATPFVNIENLELVETKKEEKKMHKILIMEDPKDSKVVIARDLEMHKETKARCGDKDTYDFYTGAKIAFERLNEANKKPKFKVGDCVIGNDLANEHYGITRKGWIGYVERLSESDPTYIWVNSKKDFTGEKFCVREECFDKCDNPPYNSKIVCISNMFGCGYMKRWTVGKIYEVKNGYLINDDGDKYGPFDNFKQIDFGMFAKFVEIKE